MSKKKISPSQLKMLNSKQGIYELLKHKELDIKQVIKDVSYKVAIEKEQEKLIQLQQWVIENDEKVVIIFEGRDVAGKGGAIQKITEFINPRHFRTVALGVPTKDESKQWFFQRYINQLPKPGEIVFFDRSWYNRAVVEPVNGFCTSSEYQIFMSQVNDFEKMLIQSDTYVLKLYFSITKAEQAKRFEEILENPLKRWKMTKIDEKAQELWDDYSAYKEKMFKTTDTDYAPWEIIYANQKSQARMNAIKYLLESIPYKESQE